MSDQVSEYKTSYNASTKTWSGIKVEPRYGPECSLGQEALKNWMNDPEHIAQICYHNDKMYTNQEMANFSIRIAQHFKRLDAEQCDIIGVCASNSDFVASLFFGALLCGMTVNTLDPSFDKDGIQHIFSITKPKFMFCDGDIYAKVKEALEENSIKAKIYTLKDHIEGVSNITEFLQETGCEKDFNVEPLKLGCNQTAAILCSSGTTGLPKGVCMSHASLLNSFHFDFDREDKILCFSTLYWMSGLGSLIVATLENTTRVISDKVFSPEDLFDIVEKYKISILVTPPSQMAMLVASTRIANAKLSSIRRYMCGGGAVAYTLVERIRPFMPKAQILSNYGLSEINTIVAIGTCSANGSIGQLMDNCQFKIIDDNDNRLGSDEVGELCVRTIYPWAGYYNNPQSTNDTYRDGWVHSGDLGYISAAGLLFIVDRKKDIMKYNNFQYSPTEIESVLLKMPEVAEVCVCGIADLTVGTLPAAMIVMRPSCFLTEAAVMEFVAMRVTHFKQLRGGVYFVEEIPKTASGKYLRRKVTEMCENLRKAKLSMEQ